MSTNELHTKSGPMFWIALALVIFVATFSIYFSGVSEHFILDDVHNLQPVADHPELPLTERFEVYVKQQIAGPTGRPVSALSFFLNGTQWPASATSYKISNIVLHLVTGGLVFLLSNLLLIAINVSDPGRRHFVGVLATALWMLSPMQVSTVLYVVQRMTQLYALFLIAAAALYVKMRIDIHNANAGQNNVGVSRRQWAVLWMGCGSLVALAMGSKESAIVFPLLLLALDHTMLSELHWPTSRAKVIWRLCAIVAPIVGLVAYASISWPVYQSQFVLHDFGPLERLLTQPRVLVDYVSTLLLPRVHGLGLMHDDYVASRSLIDPVSTFVAVMLVTGALLFACVMRKRFKVLAFAILWFIGAHFLEASVLPIELYFEHRNYLPAVSIAFACAVAALWVSQKSAMGAKVGSVVAVCLIAALSVQTARSWKDPLYQAANWAAEHPQSIRAKLQFGHLLRAAGATDEALSVMEPNGFKNPDSLHYIAYGNMGCMSGKQPATPWIEPAIANVSAHRVSRFLPMQLQYILLSSMQGKCDVSGEDIIRLVDAHLKQPASAQYEPANYDLHAIKQRVLVNLGRLDEAADYLNLMNTIRPQPSLLLAKASIHLELGELTHADSSVRGGLELLNTVEPALAVQLAAQFRATETAIAKAREAAASPNRANGAIADEASSDTGHAQ